MPGDYMKLHVKFGENWTNGMEVIQVSVNFWNGILDSIVFTFLAYFVFTITIGSCVDDNDVFR